MWNTQLGDINRGESMTMAPLVVKDKVLVGNSGGEFGVRGWLTALDVDSGKIAWRAYSTGPDADVLIGSQFKPFYAQDRGKDQGVSTWPPEAWKIGGGTVWDWISYDPELNLIFHGTANPSPWNAEQRPGDNKWTAGLFARSPDNGAAHWFYQWTPHDVHDYDGINENILIDLPIQGQTRKVLVRPERNGYLYVLDRVTGEVLSATPYVHVTTSQGVDLKTGPLIPVEDKQTQLGKVVRDICPAAPGAKDWQPAAFSPRTGLLYIPHNNLCMDFEGVEANYIAGTPYVGANVKMYAGPGGHRGEFTAWDPVAAKKVWSLQERFPVWSGALVTAGDVAAVIWSLTDGWPGETGSERRLRVCADPNNLPFSNQRLEGFENRLAELIGRELRATVQYTWWAQRRGFFRNTLNAGACDVVLGVPHQFELAHTTRPYYRATSSPVTSPPSPFRPTSRACIVGSVPSSAAISTPIWPS
jgi:lanthanide-dependent methanol dehydrogenase